MRATLTVAAVATALAALSAAPASANIRYDTPCSGTFDTTCYHDFCGIADCTRSDCVVYTGVLGDGNAGICVGLPR